MPAPLQQPNMQIITESSRALLEEIPRFANIPAIQGAGAILAAINALGERVDARLVASDTNSFARTCNSSCQKPTDELTPLVHAATGEAIENFPATVAASNALRGPVVNAILTALGRPIHGNVDQRRRRLLLSIGVTMQVVAD